MTSTTARTPDFSGYASKAGLKCADGLTILAHAFKGQDGKEVPLVWNHIHDDPDMVLGHAVVEDRADGTYVRAYFNDGPKAQQAKHMLMNGDIKQMSIYAARLIKRGMDVVHGFLAEVSLVLAGANPGANIDQVSISHSSMGDEFDAFITTGLPLENGVGHNAEGEIMADDKPTKTLEDVYNKLDEDGQNLVHYLLGRINENNSLEHSLEDDKDDDDLDDDLDDDQDDSDDSDDSENQDDSEDSEDGDLKHNLNPLENNMATHRVFDKQNASLDGKGSVLTHSQLQTIVQDAQRMGSLKDSFLKHAGNYGIDNIETLFPEAKAISEMPEFISRRMEWVNEVLSKVRHIPYGRIKTIQADITADEARAKGYVKGDLKKEEVFGLLSRVTTPATIYKKQKLDRDDEIDIRDIDVIVFMKTEMRILLEEEIARAILLGDGREVDDADKVREPAAGSTEGSGIRSIANDHSLYAHQVQIASGLGIEGRIDALVRARSQYRGSGNPVFYTTLTNVTDMLLSRDALGRRMYSSMDDLATALLASKIVTVDPMEDHQELVGIYVNLTDYGMGTDKGGEINFFDDFDLDYNQKKFLYETRCSGALLKYQSAVVVRRALGTLVTPTSPSFDGLTNTITIPEITGVSYFIAGEEVIATEVITADVVVTAKPDEGYDFPTGVTTAWPFNFSG